MPTFEKTGSIPFDPKIGPTELLSHFGKCFWVFALTISGFPVTKFS
jgi:hypothetical protein